MLTYDKMKKFKLLRKKRKKVIFHDFLNLLNRKFKKYWRTFAFTGPSYVQADFQFFKKAKNIKSIFDFTAAKWTFVGPSPRP